LDEGVAGVLFVVFAFACSLSLSLSPCSSSSAAATTHLFLNFSSLIPRTALSKTGKQQRAKWNPTMDRRMLVAGGAGNNNANGVAPGAGRFGMLPPPAPPHSFAAAAPPLYGGGPAHHSDAPPRLDDINTIWLDAGEGERYVFFSWQRQRKKGGGVTPAWPRLKILFPRLLSSLDF
jgi:hypothetical protein